MAPTMTPEIASALLRPCRWNFRIHPAYVQARNEYVRSITLNLARE